MRLNYLKTILKTAVLVTTVLLLGASLAVAQISLIAAPSTLVTPDGATVQMWGYTCSATTGATCAKLNPTAAGWSPVVITVPTGSPLTPLTISLTNNLPAGVPTSLVIVGQLGGGLGATPTLVDSPPHAVQGATWPVADPGTTNTPPSQGQRVQSFSTEVAPGTTTVLPAWENLRPGTYLFESGTHPSIQGPMGLYGILVVTTAPAGTTAGTAYPGVSYNADVPLLLSEIDPVQNAAVAKAVTLPGFSETTVWSGQPGGCGNAATANSGNCSPPAVNYSPLYYLVNGVAFNKTSPSTSLFAAAPASGVTGNVLVRLVNAGLRMHVPSIVGSFTTPTVVPTGVTAAPASGFSLVGEDGNPLPGVTRVQSEVFMAAGKTYDVMINVPAGTTALPLFDRQLSLSANATARDAGMLAYISVNGGLLPGGATAVTATAVADTYNSVVSGKTLTVSDPAKGVIGNDVNISGVRVLAPVAGLTLNTDGTFTYLGAPTSFTYCGNGATSGPACATVTLGAAPIEIGGITCASPIAYTSTMSTYIAVKAPGVLSTCKDAAGYPLTVAPASVSAAGVVMDESGGFTATSASSSFTFQAQNSQGTLSAAMTVNLTFPTPSHLAVTLVDGVTKAPLPGNPQDYRWIIEEDRTFYIDPSKQTNTGGTTPTTVLPMFGTNFHTSYMPVVAEGCTGTNSCESGQTVLGVPAVCDVGNGACRTDAAQKTVVLPSDVVLDPSKRYYISVLPGDAMDPGHAMGGAQIVATCTPVPPATTCTPTTFPPVTVIVEPESQPPAKLSVFVFEDDHPLNGEHDASGGIDTLAPNEPGLGGFNITIFDQVGGTGDSAGQLTYDEFNQPLGNALAGTIDPVTQADACPISAESRVGFDNSDGGSGARDGVSLTGITGVIPVCPKYEADGTTLSPLAGQAVVAGMPPGRYGIVATPGADRISRGEEWLQTNTLDGGKDHESFLKVNEPSYFQEFGPAGYHVSVGFANPAVIEAAGNDLCASANCNFSVSGMVTGVHMSRPSDERLYGTGTRDTFGYTQCYVSLGSPDGADIRFTRCADDGSFTLSQIPSGDWRVTIFDQWNDQIVDGISTPVRLTNTTGNTHCTGTSCNMGEVAVHAWKNNLTTRTFIDLNGDGVSQDGEPGLSLVPTNIRFRDGSISNLNSTDLDGNAGFNEVFPLFNWYVLETDSTRFRNTGIHVVNDAGGPVDGSSVCGTSGYPACGTSTIGANMARTHEDFPLPSPLRVPGARYCANADCPTGDTLGGSTGRVDPPWVTSYGWQSYAGQNQFLEFGKTPFTPGQNGGIRGHVVYTSTRPFDDPALLLQLTWEPMVPNVTINLYSVGTAPDGSRSLTLVDSTKTSSWDAWAQGFYPGTNKPYMNCPGQDPGDLFYFTIQNQPQYLDLYNSQHGGPSLTPLPNSSQYKCYDGMHSWNQLQPAPYDGMYSFPSIIGRDPSNGVPVTPIGVVAGVNGTPSSMAGTNCTICVAGPDGPMLPVGRYVVEMQVPPGYELVKEEDKNILLGDTYEAPTTQQFAGFGNIFIMPDQASVAASYNANNPLIQTTNEGVSPRHEGDTGSVETFWPCVGTARIVPDFMSLFPGSGQNAPFAGATRNLCDRKEVVLEDQMTVLAKFYVFTSTHVAGHFTGIITDDFTSEFDPFSPHFGEKFSPANLPVSVKDWAGNEISRVYSDQYGIYDGLNYSTFSVNPPDPSGYIPTMMVMCMNDRGSAVAPDPLYQASYSQFCYELPFMPGQTGYFDTPVIPTTAFAEGYNHPDCAYPDATPAISEVDGDRDSTTVGGGIGPWISAPGLTHRITIHALGDKQVDNYGYSGPKSTAAPWNTKTINRHYGFGASQGTGSVFIGGVQALVTSWSDTQIVVTLPTLANQQVPLCSIQQRGTGNGGARCGELVITAGNGKRSVDTVTVTIGGKSPTRLTPGQTIQSAIDAATPGDLIIVPPGTYSELLLMWKPVRLQGVGAASSIIDANAQPAGKLNDWRRRVVCLFGLGTDGVHSTWNTNCRNTWGTTVTGWTATLSDPQVDRLPLEATTGWDATLNGNLAEQLQEPTLMGAYEGAGITVLAKGVNFPNNNTEFAADTFPTGTTLLTGANANNTNCNAFASDFYCNPSRIDGLSITNSSQGGGGIFVHGWAHNLEVANNRIHNNQGTLAGGISIGQGEHPDAYLAGAANPDPGSCQVSGAANTQLPYCFDRFVNVHHNAVTTNSSEGDELFAATPSGAGGVAFCTGADNYQFNFNWVCGNLSTGDGAGVSQLGFVWDGSIQHNTIIFNQSTNPTTPSNGGGLLVMSAPDSDPTCPGEPDQDCNLRFGTVGDGIGRNLVINANLIMGNAADAGSGGGLRLQGVNGSEVSTFPTNPDRWYSVDVTNNIITNNVAGWDGAGVSLQDALAVNLINNTIVSNDSTASSGALFGAFFADQTSAPTACPQGTRCVPISSRQPAGVSSAGHSAEFLASLPSAIRCPVGHGVGGTAPGGRTNGACRAVSFPILYNDVIWQNRAFNIVDAAPTSGAQQATVALVPQLNQSSTGQCPTATNYWDIGLRGDSGPTNHNSGYTFDPKASVLTSIAGYPGGPSPQFGPNTATFTPGVASQYCNGARVPPENPTGLGSWYLVPPGTNEGNVPVPIFSQIAGATVDEGNNWINITWGPLSMTNPLTNAVLGNYSLAANSPAIGYITPQSSVFTYQAAPNNDFFENPRKNNNAVDVGAVEFPLTGGGIVAATLTPTTWDASCTGNAGCGALLGPAQMFTLTNTGVSTLTGITAGQLTGTNANQWQVIRLLSTCGTAFGQLINQTTLAPGSSCVVTVQFRPTTAGAKAATLTVTDAAGTQQSALTGTRN